MRTLDAASTLTLLALAVGACSGSAPGTGSASGGSPCTDTTNDAKNCGACGHDCQGGACQSSTCQPVTLASGQTRPWDLALDATSVYWVNHDLGPEGRVMSVPLRGGAAKRLGSDVAGLAGPSSAIAVTASRVYWTSEGAAQDGAISTVELNGGIPFWAAGQQNGAYGLALDATHLYWSRGAAGAVYALGAVFKKPIAGGEPVQLAKFPVGISNHIAVDASYVYATNRDVGVGYILKVPLAGGSFETLASGQDQPWDIAVDGSNVYWTNNVTNGSVMKVPIGGGTPVALASGQSRPTCLAVDASHVYWTNATGGTVMKVPIGGGTPVAIASGQKLPWGIAVDATSVYWTAPIDDLLSRVGPEGTVMKIAK